MGVRLNNKAQLNTAGGGIFVGIAIEEKPSFLCANFEDGVLIEKVRQGNMEALEVLMKKYQSFVKIKANRYFLIGADREDIIQEGMIGLFKAIRDFNGEKQSYFKAFAELCITRQIITAIKAATRQKHTPLNSSISLDMPIYEENPDHTLMEVMTDTVISDPVAILIDKESADDLELKLSEVLSPLEKKVLAYYLEDLSYIEMSDKLNTHAKSIDNALQRVKRKLESLLELRNRHAIEGTFNR
ncbi:RNA polymerase sporulation sigma factor SigH [Peribacillus frigoritolerans]|jgi:RNA polymerase sporulation-specific sigma factor|uniref:RNA polymerase sporulation sigma factor SigH n=1 Tax=Peribacillus frigoritolerans TaxID=450367 RepID=UPI00352D10DC